MVDQSTLSDSCIATTILLMLRPHHCRIWIFIRRGYGHQVTPSLHPSSHWQVQYYECQNLSTWSWLGHAHEGQSSDKVHQTQQGHSIYLVSIGILMRHWRASSNWQVTDKCSGVPMFYIRLPDQAQIVYVGFMTIFYLSHWVVMTRDVLDDYSWCSYELSWTHSK